MPLNNDEMDRRRQKREQARKQMKRTQRRMVLLLILAVAILAGCVIAIYRMAHQTPDSQPVSAMDATTQATTEATEPTSGRAVKDPITKIHIRAVGDLNVTNASVDAGIVATGYDYTRAFRDVAAELGAGDVTVMNMEGNFCGEPYGSETASAPVELLTYLKNAGVDLIQMANSYSIQNGLIGLNSTLNAIRTAGMEPLGAYASVGDFRKTKGYTICDVQGIKVAFVAFTKGVGGMGMPEGSQQCVNLLYEDYESTYKTINKKGITAILKDVAAEKPDLTVAMLHWGSVNNDQISKTQEQIVTLMQKNGVDVIIGTHPHTLQPIEFDKSTGTLVAYSLGDFFGDANRGATNYSVILDLEITKDENAGTTKVTDYTLHPIYTVRETECVGNNDRRVVRVGTALSAYKGNFLDKVTDACKESMEYALTRIDERTVMKEEEDK